MTSQREINELRARLREDWPFYARTCLYIVDKSGRMVQFEPKRAQLELDAKLEEQRARGVPMRAAILKARKIGFSTYVQGKVIHRVTQLPNHRALVVGQDSRTAGELFGIGEIMHSQLPDDPDLGLKPMIANRRRRLEMTFGEPSRIAREEGRIGLNSSLTVDTAREVEAGRGFTYHSLHLSEVAFWDSPRKLVSLLNAVPDEPGTLVIQESTANGYNHFKDTWDAAEQGRSGYVPHFEPWWKEPEYAMAFLDDEDREHFIASIGTGDYGEDEGELVEQFGCTPEQLQWRRHTIINKCEGDLRIFSQEYPATPGQAFMSSGSPVFSPIIVEKVLREVEMHDPQQTSPDNPGPETGHFTYDTTVQKSPYGVIEVPRNPLWVPAERPREPYWKVWHHPIAPDEGTPAGQYVIGADPASGDEEASDDDTGKRMRARHAICVIDHRSRVQVAEYVSRTDPDELAVELMIAALFWNRAWLAPENQGGYGLSICRRLHFGFRYPFLYKRKSLESRHAEQVEDKLGWGTTRSSKVALEDTAKELLRTGSHGIRSRELVFELKTYVRNQRGKTGPERGKYADRLMAWMIAQQIAQEKPLRPERTGGRVTSTWTKPLGSAATGY